MADITRGRATAVSPGSGRLPTTSPYLPASAADIAGGRRPGAGSVRQVNFGPAAPPRGGVRGAPLSSRLVPPSRPVGPGGARFNDASTLAQRGLGPGSVEQRYLESRALANGANRTNRTPGLGGNGLRGATASPYAGQLGYRGTGRVGANLTGRVPKVIAQLPDA